MIACLNNKIFYKQVIIKENDLIARKFNELQNKTDKRG